MQGFLKRTPFFFLQRHIFSALSQIAKHSVDLAEMVVEAEIFPAVLACLKGETNRYILNCFIYLLNHYLNRYILFIDKFVGIPSLPFSFGKLF